MRSWLGGWRAGGGGSGSASGSSHAGLASTGAAGLVDGGVPGLQTTGDVLVEGVQALVLDTAGADIVIPYLHWGWERETDPSPRQREFARLMIEAGADAVVGTHPHVTQGTDIYRGKPIIYSLGNFVFDGFEMSAARIGWLLKLEVDRDGVRVQDIIEAHLDADGTPHPAGALSLSR